ncbi:MAG: hypothetical protein GKR88_10275 [Flavobacteriaceae bacterium]|nr:MAG: hypothetical protein GKR88_10275 [Flavobacteriaceae bacterium]
MKLLKIFSLYVCFLFSLYGVSQKSTKNPCDAEVYAQFNFWAGSWNVYNTDDKLIGTNRVVKLQNNCLLQENWESKTSASKGTSYNYYNRPDKTWNQIWVDNSGYSLRLKGVFIDGKMVLKSDPVKNKNGTYYHQITWSKKKDGSVHQIWTHIGTDGNIVKELFRGIYKKK